MGRLITTSFRRSIPPAKAQIPVRPSPRQRPCYASHRADRAPSHRWKHASEPHMDCKRRGNELSRKAFDDQRRSVYTSFSANRDELHGSRPHKRHGLLLCRLRTKFRRRKRQFLSSSATPVAPPTTRHGGQCAGDYWTPALAQQLPREAQHNERRTIHTVAAPTSDTGLTTAPTLA